MQQNETFSTLEEIQLRRDQLSDAIDKDEEQIASMWHEVFKKNEDATKGEHIAAIINNSIMAIDAFLLVRKLMKNYSSALSLFNFRKKKKKK